MARLTAKARKVRMNGGGYRNPSRITTGADVVPGVDHRTIWVRRFRDVQALLISDRGGEDNISEAKKLMVRRIATQEIELLNMETKFALAGGATPEQLNGYNSTANSQRRLLEAIGIERVPRPVSGKGAQPEQTNMPVIDVDPITAEVHKRAFDGSDALLAQLYREKFEREGFSDEPRAINVILPEGYRPPDAPNNEPLKDEEPSSLNVLELRLITKQTSVEDAAAIYETWRTARLSPLEWGMVSMTLRTGTPPTAQQAREEIARARAETAELEPITKAELAACYALALEPHYANHSTAQLIRLLRSRRGLFEDLLTYDPNRPGLGE